MLAGCTTGDVTSTPGNPARTITSASPIVAQQIPTAPASTCRRAMRTDLWVFACGRSRTPAARQ